MGKLKKYINEKNEVQFYYSYIYIGFFLAVLSGSLVIQGISEGRGNGYIGLWVVGGIISLLIEFSSTIKYIKKK